MGNEVMKVRLTADGIQEVVASLKKVQGEVAKTGKAGKSATDALGSLGTIFAARQLASFVANALEAADGLFKMSQKTGVAVEQLSVFTYQAQLADVSSEDLSSAFGRLSKSMDALASGDKGTVEAFARLGLSAEELKGLNLDQVMLKVANAQSSFADGAGKSAVMMQIFGKSGANLLPLMNDLANNGFENAKKKLEELGLVISADMARASQDFNDSMTSLKLAAQGAAVQVAQGVLPGITNSITSLTAALAGMPVAVKAFSGSFLLFGTAATAATIAVRTLYTAIAGLGPIGLAVVAISAMVSGLIALKAAQEAAQAAQVKANEEEYQRVQTGKELVNSYAKESEALKKGYLSTKERNEYEERLKKIKEELIKLSPDYKTALDSENKSLKDQVDAMKLVVQLQEEDLKWKRKALESELAKVQAEIDLTAASDAQMEADRKMQEAAFGVSQYGGTGGYRGQLEKRKAALQAQRDALSAPIHLTETSDGKPKPSIPGAVDSTVAKKAASEAMAAAKRELESRKQTLEEFNKLNEHYHDQELIDLDDYLENRRNAIEYAGQIEIKALQDQIEAEKKLGKDASQTKINDLVAEIAIRKRATGSALQEDNWKAEEDRKKAKDLAVTRAGTALEQDQGRLNLGLAGVDTQREAGLISENEAIARKIALYQQYLPLLEQEARLQVELAATTDDAADDLKAQQNLADVEALKIKFGELGDKMKWLKDTAKEAATSGLAEFFMSLGNDADSLSDKIMALGRSIAQAVMQAAAMKMATAAMGGMGFAGGGWTGPGGRFEEAGIVHRDEFVFSKPAVRNIGVGALNLWHNAAKRGALSGLTMPRGSRPGYADGGLVGGGAQPQGFKSELDGTLRIDMGEGMENFVLSVIKKPDAVRIMAENSRANAKRFNSALGRR